ncbi:MAG: tRNA (N6-isopentenyl adenosine(37)-C2)-methylthiotransferase MiaB, partial [Myxococcota bacterium]
YAIRTYGCQMNVHDSEKLANLLHHAGLRPAVAEGEADLLVINTCSIREKAEQHLYSDLGRLRQWKKERPGRLVGVGGCVAQQVGDGILKRVPQVDFVFGTHNLRMVPAMIESGDAGQRSLAVAENRSLERFDFPERQPAWDAKTPGTGFITVMEGCDMFCTFCIVPQTRGREISRPAASILSEVRQRVAAGVREVTLLGQTVNAYGRQEERRGQDERAGTVPFATLLEEINAIPGLERIRYTSPHPLFFGDALIRAHGALERLAPHVHLPLQSGSDRILESMRRRYSAGEFLETVAALRRARSDIAITTDLIVGFPGETSADFRRTLAVVAEAGFVDHYSFKYSPRPGTRAAEMGDSVPAELAQERLEELQALQRGMTLAYHRRRVGERTEILLEGPSRRGGGQFCGRDPYHRIVNLAGESGGGEPIEVGHLLQVDIVEATPHSLIGVPVSETAGGRLPVVA